MFTYSTVDLANGCHCVVFAFVGCLLWASDVDMLIVSDSMWVAVVAIAVMQLRITISGSPRLQPLVY